MMKNINDYKNEIDYYLDQGENFSTQMAADTLKEFIRQFYSDRIIRDLVINQGDLLCWNIYMRQIVKFKANGTFKEEILTNAIDHFVEMMLTVISDAHLPSHNEKLRIIRSDIKSNGTYYASLNVRSTNMMIFSNLLYMIRLVHDISDDKILYEIGQYISDTRTSKYTTRSNIHIIVH